MYVGKNCYIADTWIPDRIATGLKDINDNDIYTRNTVKLNGCSSTEAIVGINIQGKFTLFFGSNRGSCGWELTDELIQSNKIRLLQQ